ncbi:MAG TPA: response regulator [Nitrospina sp.]|nr:response regulator [Nitrospina sp.]
MAKKILVADDSITIQKVVAMAFEKEDAVVEGISNGKEAFDKMSDFQPDIVLADVDMPGLTGFELSKKIKADPSFHSTKVLLLASDFEDFNETLYNESGADDHISKPFKSDNIVKRVVELISGDTAKETVDLSAEDMDEAIEPAAATELTPVAKVSPQEEEDVLDEMIKDVESLKEMTYPLEVHSDYDELGEVAPTEEDDIGEELDTAFREIVNFGSGVEPENSPTIRQEPIPEPVAAVDSIIPEPEDLLEKMTPSALARKKGITGPNLIQESLSYLSQASQEPKSQQAMASHRTERIKDFAQSMDPEDERFVRVVGEHVKQILENSPHTSIEKEIAGLSDSITQAVREVVREITPQIAREIIKEEIDKIKNA